MSVAGAYDVTVVVVSYDHGRFVEEALDSVLDQTVRPARMILVDDASPDDSAAVMQAWVERHPEVDVVLTLHAENTGLARGLNEALGLVRTPWYTVMAADDRMLAHRLERQLERLHLEGADVCAVYSDAHRIDAVGRRLTPDYGTINNWEAVAHLEGDLHTDLLAHNWIPAASVLLRTDAVRGVAGYNEEWFIEDHDMWLRLTAAGGRFLCVAEPLVEVRELPTSLGSSNFGAERPGHLAARIGILLDQLGVSDEGDAYIRRTAPHLAVRLWRTGERPDVVRRVLEIPGLTRDPRWLARALLVRCGITREPRLVDTWRRTTARARRRPE